MMLKIIKYWKKETKNFSWNKGLHCNHNSIPLYISAMVCYPITSSLLRIQVSSRSLCISHTSSTFYILPIFQCLVSSILPLSLLIFKTESLLWEGNINFFISISTTLITGVCYCFININKINFTYRYCHNIQTENWDSERLRLKKSV